MGTMGEEREREREREPGCLRGGDGDGHDRGGFKKDCLFRRKRNSVINRSGWAYLTIGKHRNTVMLLSHADDGAR